jgi:hypothetical protein
MHLSSMTNKRIAMISKNKNLIAFQIIVFFLISWGCHEKLDRKNVQFENDYKVLLIDVRYACGYCIDYFYVDSIYKAPKQRLFDTGDEVRIYFSNKIDEKFYRVFEIYHLKLRLENIVALQAEGNYSTWLQIFFVNKCRGIIKQ